MPLKLHIAGPLCLESTSNRMDYPHKGPVMWKVCSSHDAIMIETKMNMGHQVFLEKMNDGQGPVLLEITFWAIMVATQDFYWLRKDAVLWV